MSLDVSVRRADTADAEACAAIYAPYVARTAVSFEAEPPSVSEMAERIRQALDTHDWLVAERDGAVIGYAYGHSFAARAAYRWACETSIYLDVDHRGSGVGSMLYAVLLERLAARGYTTALAGMTLPNPASDTLHRAMGFEPAGLYRRVGWKHGVWHDVAWFQRDLGPTSDLPSEPR